MKKNITWLLIWFLSVILWVFQTLHSQAQTPTKDSVKTLYSEESVEDSDYKPRVFSWSWGTPMQPMHPIPMQPLQPNLEYQMTIPNLEFRFDGREFERRMKLLENDCRNLRLHIYEKDMKEFKKNKGEKWDRYDKGEKGDKGDKNEEEIILEHRGRYPEKHKIIIGDEEIKYKDKNAPRKEIRKIITDDGKTIIIEENGKRSELKRNDHPKNLENVTREDQKRIKELENQLQEMQKRLEQIEKNNKR